MLEESVVSLKKVAVNIKKYDIITDDKKIIKIRLSLGTHQNWLIITQSIGL
jgi:hypothetical protein